MSRLLTADILRSALNYDPMTGVLTWKHRSDRTANWNVKYAGTVAGALNPRGYRIVQLNCVKYLAHRLAWLHMTGEWPPHHIDHWDLQKTNNAFSNLRPATHQQNTVNAPLRSDNKSGLKGVFFFSQTSKWGACIRKDGRSRHLGYFLTAQEAHEVYCKAARELFGEFARAS